MPAPVVQSVRFEATSNERLYVSVGLDGLMWELSKSDVFELSWPADGMVEPLAVFWHGRNHVEVIPPPGHTVLMNGQDAVQFLGSDYTDVPPPGARLRFLGTRPHRFVDVVEAADRNLRVDEIYTLRSIRVNSSWTAVTLAETGEETYCLGFFYEILPRTQRHTMIV